MAAPTTDEIMQEIVDLMPASFDGPALSIVNQGLRQLAGQILLPALETQDDVSTSTALSYVSLPSNYQRELTAVYSDDQSRHVDIYKNLTVLRSEFTGLDSTGPVYGVTIRNRELHYQYIPSEADTLTLHFYEYPTLLTQGGAGPTCLPEHLVKPLLVNQAMVGIMDRLLARVELTKFHQGYKSQKAAFGIQFSDAIRQLRRFIGPEKTRFKELRA